MDNLTNFKTKCDILSEVWLEYKGNPDFDSFLNENEIGLSLAFNISTLLVISTPKAEPFVNDVFEKFLELIGKTDTGYNSLDEIAGLED
jgi:hypothetical protein